MHQEAGPTTLAPIIDLHCHAAGVGAGGSGCLVSDRLQRNWRYRVFLRAFGVTEELLAAAGDGAILRRLSEQLAESNEVSAAVVLALDGAVDEHGELDRGRTELYVPNEFVARETLRYPNLLFGASVNPYRRDARERLEAAAEGGAVLLKWLPPIQGIDPADPRLAPFYRRLEELRLPLLVHTGSEHSFTRGRNELGDPQRLRLPLELGVTVIAAHGAGSGRTAGQSNLARLLPLFAEFPNLYADISSLTQVNKRRALPRLLGHPTARARLVYGTDMPVLATALVSPLFFLHRLNRGAIREIQSIANPWERDLALKRALGVPEEVFRRGRGLLRLPGRPRPAAHLDPAR
ncbi:MAG: amidohydrolase family protein [Deltaproteobacteria bacterium]|nr:amidohydrolase family protein [Deltaproteobacteria bacterium]